MGFKFNLPVCLSQPTEKSAVQWLWLIRQDQQRYFRLALHDVGALFLLRASKPLGFPSWFLSTSNASSVSTRHNFKSLIRI